MAQEAGSMLRSGLPGVGRRRCPCSLYALEMVGGRIVARDGGEVAVYY
jgi:hypothetical protein